MFPANGRHPQHNVWPPRPMGPPQINRPPQPVEIEPGSYPRISNSYTPWESAVYSVGYVGEANPSLSSSLGHNKSGPISLDFGTRNTPPDPLTAWYTGNDGPWIAKAAVPEAPQDERIPPRGYNPYRNPGYGSPPGVRQRPRNPSENESVHFGMSPSDSGYGTGTGISLESASVRSSDIVDHNHDQRSLLSRVPEMHHYPERGPPRKSHGTELWAFSLPGANSHRCPTCHKQVKTKSELKKHHLRHTKPYHCDNGSCNRKEGFSTVNDLNRHKQSKHPGDLSGEMNSKTYHCRVSGCKSQDKIWPRLDNFRSHLKRMHRLPDDAIDRFVHRGEMEPRINGTLPSQGSSRSSPGRTDHDIPLGLVSVDFPELSYPDDHQEWGRVSSGSLDRQTEITEPLMEHANPQILEPSSGDSPICLDDAPEDGIGKPLSQRESGASWDPDAGNECLEKRNSVTSADADGKNMGLPVTESPGSAVGALISTDTSDRGKTSKLKKAPPIDPCLRDALTAVFSTTKTDGCDLEIKSQPGIGSPNTIHVLEISSCGMDSRIALPSQAVTSGNHPDDQSSSLKTSPVSANEKSDLTNEDAQIQKLLQVLKNAGYVLKKENKSQTGVGQSVNVHSDAVFPLSVGHLPSVVHKKKVPVYCPRCTFAGRPCELKKHMKRHTRPYGCTFSKCQKAFGSKNDWKRHETSQHFQSETWRCDEKINGAFCTKVFFSADIARAHLTKTHKVTDPDTVHRKIEARRSGADHQATFWCGFCRKIISLAQKGVDAWTERFNHIDDHFMGKNSQVKQSITEWKTTSSDAEGVQHNVSAQSLSPDRGEETPSGSSPVSSDTSTACSETSTLAPSADAAQSQHKRKLADSDERRGRSKQPRHGKTEYRVECCQCGLNLNPRFDTACPTDGHSICGGCQKRVTMVQEDNAE